MPSVLHIDDNQASRLLVRRVLQSAAIEVVEFDNGPAGIDWLKRAGTLPDLILLDISMPDFDGFMALREIRADKRLALIPVIFITAEVMQRTLLDRVGEIPNVGLMAKPIDINDLLQRVQSALAK